MSDEEQNVADGGGRDLRHPRPGARARPKKIVNTPRKNRTWTEEQIRLLGTLPDGEVGRMIGKPGKATGGGQFGFLQARPIEDKILADARTRHAPLSRFDWAGKEQGVFLHFRLLPEPGVLQPESGNDRWGARGIAGQTALQGTAGIDQRVGSHFIRGREGRPGERIRFAEGNGSHLT